MKQHRITITIQDDLHKKLRYAQADMLRKSEGGVSFSGVIDAMLRKALR
jgi:predicted CopG family antitoxin